MHSPGRARPADKAVEPGRESRENKVVLCRRSEVGALLRTDFDATVGPVRNSGPYGFRGLPVVFALTLHSSFVDARKSGALLRTVLTQPMARSAIADPTVFGDYPSFSL